MNPGYRSLLWYLLAGTRGGPNRIRILEVLEARPHNAHQLSENLGMDYRTVRHHLKLLEANGLVVRPVGAAYASPYELAAPLAVEFEVVREMQGLGARGRWRTSSPAALPSRRPLG